MKSLIKYYVIDCAFNRRMCSELIGKTLDAAPEIAVVQIIFERKESKVIHLDFKNKKLQPPPAGRG